MSERTNYASGTPCWVELSGTPDVEASEKFYGELFGWEIPELPTSAEMGGYRRAKKDGKDVAGVSPKMDDDQPTVWATYVSVADAEETLAKVGAAGGRVIVDAMDVAGLGKMAVFTDSTGAVCGIWQPGTFVGSELVNEPGTFGWNELGTRDTGAARDFYTAVFGWGTQDEPSPRVGTYTVWKAGEEMVGGMLDLNALGMPAEVPSNWLVYFMVENTDAAVETVKSGGGDVRMEPVDIPVGRFAVVADPFGAVFALMQPSAETLANMP
ncbi:MAG TPA: VOC family protein [Solirubrobacterales bacterium]|nr:VOC family protein [Solirubrobacterales bacterium]